MFQDNSIIFENCIENYALPIWKDKINEYYPKDMAKKYITKLTESIKYNPQKTYVTMVDNLSFLDLISNGKKNEAKKELIEKLSDNANGFREVFTNHEMLLYSNYCLEFLPIFKNFLTPRKDAKLLIDYLKRFELQNKKSC